MNSSICSADAATHAKIIIIALAAAIAVVWIGIAARPSSGTIAARAAVLANFQASLVAKIVTTALEKDDHPSETAL